MNLDKKLELAHEYAVANNSYSSDAWAYADAMEAEYNKRIKAKAEKDAEDAKVFFEKFSKNNVYSKKDGLVNQKGECLHVNKNILGNLCLDCGRDVVLKFNSDDLDRLEGILNSINSSQLEWQPDWSVAPESANYWAMDEDTCCNWYGKEPEVIVVRNRWDFGNVLEFAPSFGYQGDWKDSLRKRPK